MPSGRHPSGANCGQGGGEKGGGRLQEPFVGAARLAIDCVVTAHQAGDST